MKTTNLLRLDRLEEQINTQTKAGIWIDMMDKRVRVDVNHRRGKELTFPSVYECAAWVEKRMKESENVTGLACISNVMDLFLDEPFTYTPDDVVNQTGVVINLAGQRGQDSLAALALSSWLHGRTAPKCPLDGLQGTQPAQGIVCDIPRAGRMCYTCFAGIDLTNRHRPGLPNISIAEKEA